MENKNLNVLIVDDQKDYIEDFRLLFSKKFNILIAGGGEEALEILKKQPVAVIVSDQRMPKMQGSELLARASSLYPNTVRILLTGYADMDAVIEAINKGEIYRYISKEVPLKEIELVISQALEKYRLEESNRQLLVAKKKLLKSLAVQENLSVAGAFGRELHQRIESLVMTLFDYVFRMRKESDEKQVMGYFQKLQGVLSRLRELSSFSETFLNSKTIFQPHSVNDVIRDFMAKNDPFLKEQEKGTQIHLDLKDIPPVAMDRYSFLRMLKELVENACLFGHSEKKEIVIRSSHVQDAEEPFVRIEVEDNGPGIASDDLPRVFMPFFSSFELTGFPEGVIPPPPHEFNLSRYYHFGFGLPIVQWIACLRYQGVVDLKSHLGQGTQVILDLPLQTSQVT